MKERFARALKWSEKYTRTDMKYLATGGFWLSLGHGISMLASIALAVLFANYLSQETYGTYRYVISLFGIASLFALSGMSIAMIRGVAKSGPSAFLSGFRTYATWSIGIAIASFGFSMYYYAQGDSTLALSMLIVALFAPFYKSFSLYPTLFMGQKKWDKVTLYKIPQVTVPAIALGITVIFTNNPIFIVAVYFLVHTITLFIIYVLTKRTIPLDYDRAENDTATYGKHLSYITVLSKGVAELDKILVFHFLGAASLAVYAFALTPIGEIKVIGGITRNLVLPKLTTKDPEELKRTIDRKAFLFFLFLVPIVVIYYFLAPYMYELLFPKYIDSVYYSQLLSLSILFMPTLFYRQSLLAHKRKKALIVLDTVIPLCKLLLLIILIPLYGILGAIIATLSAGSLKFATSYVFFRKM